MKLQFEDLSEIMDSVKKICAEFNQELIIRPMPNTGVMECETECATVDISPKLFLSLVEEWLFKIESFIDDFDCEDPNCIYRLYDIINESDEISNHINKTENHKNHKRILEDFSVKRQQLVKLYIKEKFK